MKESTSAHWQATSPYKEGEAPTAGEATAALAICGIVVLAYLYRWMRRRLRRIANEDA